MARLCPLLGVIAGFFGLILYNEYMQPFLYSLDWSYGKMCRMVVCVSAMEDEIPRTQLTSALYVSHGDR